MTYLGWVGTVLLATAAFPQTIKVWREGNAKGLSWLYLGLLWVGFLCMGAYAVSKAAWPMVASYTVQVTLFTLMLIRKGFPKETS